MATARKKKTKKTKKKTAKRFRFQLSLAGVAGIGVVLFCLFLWMFLLGIWAGQTILLPSSDSAQRTVSGSSKNRKQSASRPVPAPISNTRDATVGNQSKKSACTRSGDALS